MCLLYGQPQCIDIKRARYNIFRTGLSNDRVLPTNRDSLRQHSLRANYKCAIHRLSLDAEICAPSPLNHGWTEDEGRLVFTWMTLPLAPDDIIKNVQCKCKKASCTTNRCSCHNARLNCTEMCLCQDCLTLQTMNQIQTVNMLRAVRMMRRMTVKSVLFTKLNK